MILISFLRILKKRLYIKSVVNVHFKSKTTIENKKKEVSH